MDHRGSLPDLLSLFSSFAEEEGLSSAFLVGGAVRDLLLGLPVKDADIAVAGDSLGIAESFSRRAGASFVLLDREWGTGRVVRGEEQLDISPLRGGSIASDLLERDLTINAMAIPLTGIRQEPLSVIDPLGGREDLKRRLIRMVSEENLRRDPLRVLRVYRFSATLSFAIEAETRAAALRRATLLPSVAAERISEELRQIMRRPASAPVMRELLEGGILSLILPGPGRDKERTALLYSRAEEIMADPDSLLGEEGACVTSHLSPFRSVCLKLSLLFSDPGQARDACLRLRLSGRETELVQTLATLRSGMEELCRDSGGGLDEESAAGFLRKAGDEIHLLAVSLLAFSLPDDPIPAKDAATFCRNILSFYHRFFLKRKGLLPLITGDDLKREFCLSPSPLFGELLALVEKGTLLGEIVTRDEALALVRKEMGKRLGI